MSEDKMNYKYWNKFWSKYWTPPLEKVESVKKSFQGDKILAMGIMPVRGAEGFRKLDYEFSKKIKILEVMDKISHSHFNTLGVVIKDTDGACLWNTKIGWNPTERDLLGEFVDAGKDYNIRVMVSFTSMNDAYQGHTHPERASIHGKSGFNFTRNEYGKRKKVLYHVGDVSTHDEGEMRVDLPQGTTLEQYQKVIPFLQNKTQPKKGASRGSRGTGYIPTTTFMCPNSEHVDYLVDLAGEVVKNYKIAGFFADYIRYDGSYMDICTCERCRTKFATKYGNKKPMKCSEWYDFKEDTIASYAEKLNTRIKSIDPTCVTGWFCLPGPPIFTRNRLGQNWVKLGKHLDVASPMIYPYLTGTRDDGRWWAFVAGVAHWYSIQNMKHRLKEFKDQVVLTITNSVECNAEEMLKQMVTYDFGLGTALFIYHGTKESQWEAVKKFAEEQYGLDKLGLN
jgi:hypothetical protein